MSKHKQRAVKPDCVVGRPEWTFYLSGVREEAYVEATRSRMVVAAGRLGAAVRVSVGPFDHARRRASIVAIPESDHDPVRVYGLVNAAMSQASTRYGFVYTQPGV